MTSAARFESPAHPPRPALALGGVFRSWLLLLALAASPSCSKSGDRKTHEAPPSDVTTEQPVAPPVAPSAPVTPAPATNPEPVTPPPATEAPGGLRFVAYNVENWLTMERYEDRRPVGSQPKPEPEKRAAILILTSARPDVLGLCEIGTRDDLREIQELLAQAGVQLPHAHHVTGTDATRSLGILSRFPISSTAVPEDLEYRLNGKTFGINRGILDATIDAPGGPLRFLGVHLKSKREVEEADQEAIRINEARLLRKHVDAILRADANAPLVVYGDFNDTYPSSAVRTITSASDPAHRLKPVYLRDSRREAWTHHWAPHDIYSRIDFVTLAPSVTQRVDYSASAIIDDARWDQASDHRPLLVIFR